MEPFDNYFKISSLATVLSRLSLFQIRLQQNTEFCMGFHYSTGIAKLGCHLQVLGLDELPLPHLENNPSIIGFHSRSLHFDYRSL